MRYLIFLIFSSLTVQSQVINDDIQYAKVLQIGESISSSTVSCTIQSACVNYALTKKCIKYHNDQWFVVNSGHYNHLFLNIQNQECRDLFGVQLVAIEGEACDIENYKIIDCVSFSSNDDFYVKIDSLKPNTNYLINIDGYLHDFCSFEITADTIPYGMPNEVNMKMENDGELDSAIVKLQWELNPDQKDDILFFEVRERSESFKHEVIAKIAVQRNTYGEVKKDYTFYDTLTDRNKHYYKLLAVDQKGQRFLIGEYVFQPQFKLRSEYISLTLGYKKGTPLTISIFDKNSGQIFRKVRFSFDPEKHSRLSYHIGSLIKEGVNTLVIEVENNKTSEVQRQEYSLR